MDHGSPGGTAEWPDDDARSLRRFFGAAGVYRRLEESISSFKSRYRVRPVPAVERGGKSSTAEVAAEHQHVVLLGLYRHVRSRSWA